MAGEPAEQLLALQRPEPQDLLLGQLIVEPPDDVRPPEPGNDPRQALPEPGRERGPDQVDDRISRDQPGPLLERVVAVEDPDPVADLVVPVGARAEPAQR